MTARKVTRGAELYDGVADMEGEYDWMNDLSELKVLEHVIENWTTFRWGQGQSFTLSMDSFRVIARRK